MYTGGEYERQAEQLVTALKRLTENEFGLENFGIYLAHHFDSWLKEEVNTPDEFADSISMFAKMKK